MKECCASYLNEQFGGDEDIINEIYSEYAASAKIKMEEAVAALAAEQWDPLDKIAHAIKGNALAAGDSETAEVGIALRQAAKLHDAGESGRLIEQLKTLVSTL